MIETIIRNPLTITSVHKDRRRVRIAPVDSSILLSPQFRRRLSSPCLRSAFHLMSIVAPTTINVLVQGGLDAERSIVAETIHDMSDRRKSAFIKVDCAALSSARLETELFGHVSGDRLQERQRTCFERAFQGTLLLSDIEVVPPALQRRLLDILKYREETGVFGRRPMKIDMRLIATSGHNLAELVKRSNFDRELHNLLKVFPIDIAHGTEDRKISSARQPDNC
jgi:Nif-specific regulatory protein